MAEAVVMGLLSDSQDAQVWRHPRSWGRSPRSEWRTSGGSWVWGGSPSPGGALGGSRFDGVALGLTGSARVVGRARLGSWASPRHEG